ncbi:MAG: DUF5011 domain-containing protein [Candidatus Staskawiczbacteria bacterium]|nr:DUF5011 domain-containing protein [Candidatus Staskawiczbacteria bacterium]
MVGFFVWNIFSNSNINILAKFFPASLSAIPEITDIIPAIDLQESTEDTVAPIIISRQDQLDDIQEKLDIIQQKVNELIAQQNLDNQVADVDKDKVADDQNDQDKSDQDQSNDQNNDNNENNQITVCTGQININTASAEDLDKITQVGPTTAQKIISARPFYSLNDLLRVSGIGPATLQGIIAQGCAYVEPGLTSPPAGGGGGGGGGGAPAPVLQNPLISEIQIAGQTNVNDDWVELYNPNDSSFSLKGWSIQKSGWGVGGCSVNTSFYSKHFNVDAVIPPKGFYLVVSTNADDSLKTLAASPTGMTIGWLLTGNNTIYLVKNTDDIVDYNDPDIIDEVGIGKDACSLENFKAICPGLGECPPEGESIGRKVLPDNSEQDTDDNSADFEIDTPTPKAQNTAFVPPDTTAPVITLTGDPEITITVGDVYIDAGATVLDNVDGDLTTKIIIVNPVDANAVGDYTITYNVSDVAGNSAVEVTRLVHVVAVPIASNDATVTSTVYTVSSLAGGAGTITNVSFGTAKAIFLSNLTFAVGALENNTSSTLGNPIVSNDTLAVTAQDGITESIYTITVNEAPPSVTSYTFNGSAQNVSFNPSIPSSVGIIINVSVPVKFSRIYICLNSVATCDGSHYIKYFTQTTSYATVTSKLWDGKMSNGNYAQDGIYKIVVHIVDELGNDATLTLAPYTITVDTTVP